MQCFVVFLVQADLCSLLAATSQFSILIGHNMQLTCCHNGIEMRNATCADTQISIEWPYCSFLYCALTDFTMASFYRKEVFTFVDAMSWVLSLKISSLEDSFLPLIDIVDANKTPSIDKGEKLATLFPDGISDSDPLFSEIEVFFSHCDKALTLRDTADFAIEYHRKLKVYQMSQMLHS